MKNKIKWLGHAAVEITTAQDTVILIDPWITGNPACPIKKEDIKKADLILVTHDHADHIGSDIPYLVQTTGATVLVQPEVSELLQQNGVAAENIIFGTGMNIGGRVEVAGVQVVMTQALHSSGVGSPTGFIVILEDGQKIYHAGDTGIFADMQLLSDVYGGIDVALLPIGSVFVMDPLQAAHSLTLIKPAVAVPIHYQTFPILTPDAREFVQLAQEKAPDVAIKVLKPGETMVVGQ